jgi:hypothetical protein
MAPRMAAVMDFPGGTARAHEPPAASARLTDGVPDSPVRQSLRCVRQRTEASAGLRHAHPVPAALYLVRQGEQCWLDGAAARASGGPGAVTRLQRETLSAPTMLDVCPAPSVRREDTDAAVAVCGITRAAASASIAAPLRLLRCSPSPPLLVDRCDSQRDPGAGYWLCLDAIAVSSPCSRGSPSANLRRRKDRLAEYGSARPLI